MTRLGQPTGDYMHVCSIYDSVFKRGFHLKRHKWTHMKIICSCSYCYVVGNSL